MQYKKQQELTFKKEINLLRNDFYYQYGGNLFKEDSFMIDAYYKPLEILSADTYSIRKLSSTLNFYLLIDIVGKGLPASVTAIAITSFINYLIDKTITLQNDFSLSLLIDEVLLFIKPLLLEDEMVCAHFITCDTKANKINYASFAMPDILICDKDSKLIKLQSNNKTINKQLSHFSISESTIRDMRQLLICSDGLLENKTKQSGNLYMEYIKEDFISSFSRDDMQEKIEYRLDTQTDDITFIFINKTNFAKELLGSTTIECSMQAVEDVQIWQENTLSTSIKNQDFIEKCNYPFRELVLNAFEHGNLGISNAEKHNAIANGDYWDMIEKLEKDCKKLIYISIYQTTHFNNNYILTTITDEGDGFDTKILRDILFKKENFNGRGVYISKRFSNGIYYNSAGNSILIINKIES